MPVLGPVFDVRGTVVKRSHSLPLESHSRTEEPVSDISLQRGGLRPVITVTDIDCHLKDQCVHPFHQHSLSTY